jgi:hypothetical protein
MTLLDRPLWLLLVVTPVVRIDADPHHLRPRINIMPKHKRDLKGILQLPGRLAHVL